MEEGRDGRAAKAKEKDEIYEKVDANLMFRNTRVNDDVLRDHKMYGGRPRLLVNLVATDGCGRLFVWNSTEKLLHYVAVRHSDAFSTKPASLVASKNFKTVQLSLPVDFAVTNLTFNRTGQSLVLAGDGSLMVVNMTLALSGTSSEVCRARKIGSQRVFRGGNGNWLRILQVAWHPYSDTHLGVLSSDGVLRLFDLSMDTEIPEKEYHLHTTSSGRAISSPLAQAVAFSFGGEHLWDRFTVFVLFSSGSIYALCPIVPYGSMFNLTAIHELAKDARELLSGSAESSASEQAGSALALLETLFPSLSSVGSSPEKDTAKGSLVMKAHAPVQLEAVVQGPLQVYFSLTTQDESSEHSQQTIASPCQAVNLMYSVVGKDSVLAISTKDGQVHLYVLADEVQPMWSKGGSPQLRARKGGHASAVGVFIDDSRKSVKDGFSDSTSNAWSDAGPPLFQLAVVDLALQPVVLQTGPVNLFVDPVVPERFYCQHAAGLDAVVMQWLPFSVNKPSAVVPPTVLPILEICPTSCSVPQSMLGVTMILDSLGEPWLVCLLANCECAVINMKPQRGLPTPLLLEADSAEPDTVELDAGVFQMMSKELLLGPKDIPISQMSSSGAPLTLDTIEGRTLLHDQCKLLYEKYIEYAHRVYVELTSHVTRLYEIVQDQQQRTIEYEENLGQSLKFSRYFGSRVQQAIDHNIALEHRIKKYSMNLVALGKPLTVAETELKAQLDLMQFQDLDILNTAVELLSVRSERFISATVPMKTSSPGSRSKSIGVPDSQMRRLKQAVEYLAQLVEESASRVKFITEAVNRQELNLD